MVSILKALKVRDVTEHLYRLLANYTCWMVMAISNCTKHSFIRFEKDKNTSLDETNCQIQNVAADLISNKLDKLKTN